MHRAGCPRQGFFGTSGCQVLPNMACIAITKPFAAGHASTKSGDSTRSSAPRWSGPSRAHAIRGIGIVPKACPMGDHRTTLDPPGRRDLRCTPEGKLPADWRRQLERPDRWVTFEGGRHLVELLDDGQRQIDE